MSDFIRQRWSERGSHEVTDTSGPRRSSRDAAQGILMGVMLGILVWGGLIWGVWWLIKG